MRSNFTVQDRSSRSSRVVSSFIAATVLSIVSSVALAGKPLMEKLDRGVVALPIEGNGVFVSWRLLGSEAKDTAFNLYRSTAGQLPVKINDKPLDKETCFIDRSADLSQKISYSVRTIQEGAGSIEKSFQLKSTDPAKPYLSVPIKTLDGYFPNDASVGDLDGDGQYEIILHQTGRARDNSHSGITDPPILQAYQLDGTLMWTINLGKNIRDGAHYTQFMVADFDGDGRAEMICKTSDGTIDGTGKVIGDASANHVNDGGHVLKGPELLTVFDGKTGAALATEKYLPARTNNNPENPDMQEYRSLWGDTNGNRGERYLGAVACLDGKLPSAIMCRGYYGRTALAAWDFRDGKLIQRWLFDTGAERGNRFAGQGNHNLSVADVDDDGKDEIIYGGMTVDDNGEGLFTTGFGHGDAIHIGDLDPNNPGLEMYRIQERFGDAAAHMVALKTGKTLWQKPSVDKNAPGGKGQGPGRGVAADIDPRYPGAESWALGAGVAGIWDAKGNLIADKSPTFTLHPGQITYLFDTVKEESQEAPTANFRIYWDGDTLDELLDCTQVFKWDWEKQKTTELLFADGCTSGNGTKGNPALSADILGDWREEVIFASKDGKELRIYSTTIPTTHRFPTLMHDHQYRMSIAWQNVGYNQPPHIGYYIGPEPNQISK